MARKGPEKGDLQALTEFYSLRQELLQQFYRTVREYVVNGSSRREDNRRHVNSILEVGGGADGGFVGLVWHAHYPKAKVTVIDIDESAIEHSTDIVKTAGQVLGRDPAIDVKQVDITSPEQREALHEAFDIVSIRNPRIGSISDANDQGFIQAAYDAVKPGGIIFMTADAVVDLQRAKSFIDGAIWMRDPDKVNIHAMQQEVFRDKFIMVGRKPQKNTP